jgi:hypothetical protein
MLLFAEMTGELLPNLHTVDSRGSHELMASLDQHGVRVAPCFWSDAPAASALLRRGVEVTLRINALITPSGLRELLHVKSCVNIYASGLRALSYANTLSLNDES